MAISIPQLVTQFRQAVRKFFCSPKAESASSEPGAETLSFWGGHPSLGGTVKRNAYSEGEFAREVKYRLAGLPCAIVKDDDHGQCLKFDRLVFLVDDLSIVGFQYFFRDRCVFIHEVPTILIAPDLQTTITVNLPGEGRIPFTLL